MNVVVVEGDLLDHPVDAIVNACNCNAIPWWLLLPLVVSEMIGHERITGLPSNLCPCGIPVESVGQTPWGTAATSRTFVVLLGLGAIRQHRLVCLDHGSHFTRHPLRQTLLTQAVEFWVA
jgi:hypothetical protein